MVTRAKACLGVAVFVAYLSTNAATLAGELVRFESAPVHVGQLQQRSARERGETPKAASETIEGYLSKPEGDGPFSAIVYLHGCDGLSEDARTYNARGYVSLMLDSFATRGIKNACTQVTPGLLLTRQGDALGALSYLSSLPFVDSQRIAVIGYPQGAIVALQLASNHQAEIFDVPRDRTFKAAVAYLPALRRRLRGTHRSCIDHDRRTRRLDARDGLRALDEAAGRQGSARKIDRLSRCLSRL